MQQRPRAEVGGEESPVKHRPAFRRSISGKHDYGLMKRKGSHRRSRLSPCPACAAIAFTRRAKESSDRPGCCRRGCRTHRQALECAQLILFRTPAHRDASAILRGAPVSCRRATKTLSQTGKIRAEVHAECLRTVREGPLPNAGKMKDCTYGAMMARGSAIQSGNALAQASESGTSPAGSSLSATTPPTSSLTREAVRDDTREWLRPNRGDVQIGSH